MQRELKKIRGKEVMAIVVTAPGTVDDADTTELYALEKHFKNFLRVIQTTFTMAKVIMYLSLLNHYFISDDISK